MFLGDELTGILEAIETDTAYCGVEKKKMKLGVDVLPRFLRDTTDRNRTSPFAFTGNKFEFRMLGSTNSIACANIMLNTTVAESLRLFADELEGASDSERRPARPDPAHHQGAQAYHLQRQRLRRRLDQGGH